MSDPLAYRLPDLPNAGYQTRAQKELSDAMMFLIRGLERDRYLLLETVIKGRKLWRTRFIAAFKSIKADEQFADAVFGFLCLLAGDEATWDAQKARIELMHAQKAESSWDKRLRTMLKQAQNRNGLEMDIVRESLKPRKVYSH